MSRFAILVCSLASLGSAGCESPTILIHVERTTTVMTTLHISPCAVEPAPVPPCGQGEDVFSDSDRALTKTVGIYIDDGTTMPVLNFQFRGFGTCQPMTLDLSRRKKPEFNVQLPIDATAQLTSDCPTDVCMLGTLSIDCR